MIFRFSINKKVLFSLLGAVLFLTAGASTFGDLKKLTPDDFKRLHADSWRAVGHNVIISGNAYLPAGPMEVFADQIVINMQNGDFEASGNVRIFRWQDGAGAVSLEKLAEMEQHNNVRINDVSSQVSILGERTYTAKFSSQTDRITADKVSGNLNSGYLNMLNPTVRYATFVCKAASAERTPDGIITLKDGEVSSCNYLESDNSHYSIAATEIKLTPYESRFYELRHTEFALGDCSILLVNGMVKIYGVPVLWLPVFFKPKDENPGICGFQQGRDGDLGFYINLYKEFRFSDAPELSVKLRGDFYEKRGFGYGLTAKAVTQESRTDVFVYSIHDRHPWATDEYEDYRLRVPHDRYSFRISNVTHITPRLDFRGAFNYLSDPYVMRDFFRDTYNRNPQPATFAALEQQFDLFSAAAYMRIRLNDFFTTVEKLPELRLDIPRQEIFNTGLYYQGDMEAAYMKRKWLEFDKKTPAGFSTLEDYEAFRFDMTHFLYYPVSNRYFNFIPRVGMKMTAYSDTSKTHVTEKDLQNMFKAAEPQSLGRYRFNSYDRNGGSKVRLAVELGFELSTKFHNTWQDARSAFFEVDGLRHIVQPYVNYTFIPKPTLDREKIYFFDDIDRLTRQNFFRLGLINRLQTRDGNSIRDLLYMENYWDIHMDKYDGKSAFGNIGTLISWKVFKGLSLNTEFLIDVSGDGEIADTIRHGRNVGKTGLALDWLNLWDINLTYTPAKNWEFAIGYNYVRPYDMRSSYSMGSTLTQINSASYFNQYNNTTDESFYLRAKLPLTPDHRTLGTFNFSYDVPEGSIDKIGFGVVRQFHCWQLVGSLYFDREWEDNQWEWDIGYVVSANLTGLNSVMNNVQNTVLRGMEGLAATAFKF